MRYDPKTDRFILTPEEMAEAQAELGSGYGPPAYTPELLGALIRWGAFTPEQISAALQDFEDPKTKA